MKIAFIISVLLITFCSPSFLFAQEKEDTLHLSNRYKNKLLKKSKIKSNLVFIDSVEFIRTFKENNEISDLAKKYMDSNFSFISNFDFDYVNQKIIERKGKFELAEFELPFYHYFKTVFKDFKFKERFRSNRKYWIVTEWMLYSENNQIIVRIKEYFNNNFVIIYKKVFQY